MRFTIPNLLSILRMGLIPVFVLAVDGGRFGWALAVFAIAGVTDLLDGAIARWFHMHSKLGAFLDPAADKFLLTAAFIVLTLKSTPATVTIPLWLTVIVLTRDILIVIISLSLFLALDIRKFPPSRAGRASTLVQCVTVVLVLLANAAPAEASSSPFGPGGFFTGVAIYLCLAMTVVSGTGYVWKFTRLSAKEDSPAGESRGDPVGRPF